MKPPSAETKPLTNHHPIPTRRFIAIRSGHKTGCVTLKVCPCQALYICPALRRCSPEHIIPKVVPNPEGEPSQNWLKMKTKTK